jgi:hypothetical protein
VRAAAVRDAQRRRVVQPDVLDGFELPLALEAWPRSCSAGGECGLRLAADAVLDREVLGARACAVGTRRIVPDGAASARRRPNDSGEQRDDPDQRTPTAPRTDSISFAES